MPKHSMWQRVKGGPPQNGPFLLGSLPFRPKWARTLHGHFRGLVDISEGKNFFCRAAEIRLELLVADAVVLGMGCQRMREAWRLFSGGGWVHGFLSY